MNEIINIAKSGENYFGIIPKMSNRHGLITGATGTGKTVTLQVLAENFSNVGIPVFAADIKGDLSGVSVAGSLSDKMKERLTLINEQPPAFSSNPVEFWDLFGEVGNNVRATISEMGPILLTKLLNLNEVQEGVLNIAFKVADDEGLLLIDLKDLRAVLSYLGENEEHISTKYGNVASQSIGAIQRGLLVLENQKADKFFSEPELELNDLINVDSNGKGTINIFDATKLMQTPKTYSTFLLWIMNELFEQLPEVGDLDKPKLIFFFDEAHLLFNDISSELLEKVEQVIKLVRSKGVGIFFITQNPADIPESVLAQLGNRFQHALRAYTPMEQKAVKAAASAFRENPNINTEEVITQLSTGEALISCLDEKGAPNIVERVWILPPRSQIGPISGEDRTKIISNSKFKTKYSSDTDSRSAFEVLQEKEASQSKVEEAKADAKVEEIKKEKEEKPKSKRASGTERFVNNFLSSVGRQLGNKIVRGILGGIKKF